MVLCKDDLFLVFLNPATNGEDDDIAENDTCAWTPNKVFMRLGSLGTWARQVQASLGKSAATGNPDPQAIGSWYRQV